MNYKAVIEGLLFVSGEEGLSLEELQTITSINLNDVKILIKELFDDYENDSRGIHIEFLGEKYKLTTKPEHKEFYKKIVENEENSVLSQSSLETLAIIAYNGPITRNKIDEIRGVNSSYALRKLIIMNLIEEVGTSDTAGKPKIYNITKKFLDHFGLGSVEELPIIKEQEKEEENDETDLFNSKYSE